MKLKTNPSRLKIAGCVAAALWAIAMAQAQPQVYRFAVTDAGTGVRLQPAGLAIHLDGQEAQLSTAANWATTKAEGAPKVVKVTVQPDTAFGARKITVHASGISAQSVNEFALEKKPPNYTREYLAQGVRRLERRELDRGLALFELAFHGDTSRAGNAVLDDYEVVLRYNYARSLQQACLILHYATCDEARQHLQAVLDEINDLSAERKYRSHGVVKAMVQTALSDLTKRQVRDDYQSALTLVGSKSYSEAKAALSRMAEDFSARPEAYLANGLNAGRFAEDLGLIDSRLARRD